MAPVSSLKLKNSNIISYIISYSYAGCFYTIKKKASDLFIYI